MKVRSIQSCAAEIKAGDPNTSISEYSIRAAIRDGSLRFKKSGTKYLVTMEDVLERFSFPAQK